MARPSELGSPRTGLAPPTRTDWGAATAGDHRRFFLENCPGSEGCSSGSGPSATCGLKGRSPARLSRMAGRSSGLVSRSAISAKARSRSALILKCSSLAPASTTAEMLGTTIQSPGSSSPTTHVPSLWSSEAHRTQLDQYALTGEAEVLHRLSKISDVAWCLRGTDVSGTTTTQHKKL